MKAPPIQRLVPVSTHSSPSRRAVVARPPAMSEPCSGSVRQNTPVISKDVIFGSHAANCSGVPPTRQAVRNSPAWAV